MGWGRDQENIVPVLLDALTDYFEIVARQKSINLYLTNRNNLIYFLMKITEKGNMSSRFKKPGMGFVKFMSLKLNIWRGGYAELLVLRSACTTCGGEVAYVIEGTAKYI